jgi:hypothetical protein
MTTKSGQTIVTHGKPQLDKETGMTSYIAPAQITINGFFILSPLITTARARRERGKCITIWFAVRKRPPPRTM